MLFALFHGGYISFSAIERVIIHWLLVHECLPSHYHRIYFVFFIRLLLLMEEEEKKQIYYIEKYTTNYCYKILTLHFHFQFQFY